MNTDIAVAYRKQTIDQTLFLPGQSDDAIQFTSLLLGRLDALSRSH